MDFLQGHGVIGQGLTRVKLKEGRFRFRYKEEILYNEGGETLEQQRSCGCPLPGSVQAQAGWGFEQPGLAEDVPAHGRVIGTR